MATLIEKAYEIAETYCGNYEVFATVNDVQNYIAGAPADEEIWQKRVAACEELIADFTPCIFDNVNACVACSISDDEFYFDGKTYKAD